MPRAVLYLILSGFFLLATPAMAQDDETYYDSVMIEPPQQEKYFEKFQPGYINERTISAETIKDIKSEDHYWYADMAPAEKKETKKSTGIFATPWVVTMFWILVFAGFALLLGWFLVSANIIVFRKKPKTISSGEEELLEEQDIFSLDYERELQKALNAGNYRMAVRLLYLQTLKQLSELEIIKYAPAKTNADYLSQLAKSRHYNNFFRLTRHFDYVWYGKFNLSQEGFQAMQKDFSTFKQQLG
jgi:hypothetical protein